MQKLMRLLPWIAGSVVVVVAFAAGMWLSSAQRGDAAGIDGLLWPEPPAVAPFHLIDQDGRPFTLEDLRGHWTLLFFGFTHCPDVCPTTLDAMARAAEALASNEAWAEQGQVVFVSVDPERDTPEAIGQYVRYFAPGFVGVTGGVEELKSLARSLGVLFVKVPLEDDGYTMDHSAGVFFVAPDGRLVSVLTPPHSSSAIVARFEPVQAFIADRL